MMLIVHIEANTLAELGQRLREQLRDLITPAAATAAPAAEPKPEAPKPDAKKATAEKKAAEKAAADAAKADADAKADEGAAAAEEGSGEAPMTLEQVRAILGEYQAKHPKKAAAVVDLLKEHGGGAKKLSEADASVYPAMVGAAQEWLTVNG